MPNAIVLTAMSVTPAFVEGAKVQVYRMEGGRRIMAWCGSNSEWLGFSPRFWIGWTYADAAPEPMVKVERLWKLLDDLRLLSNEDGSFRDGIHAARVELDNVVRESMGLINEAKRGA
jgi:hypothetical protein